VISAFLISTERIRKDKESVLGKTRGGKQHLQEEKPPRK